jgi:hypothetical protein
MRSEVHALAAAVPGLDRGLGQLDRELHLHVNWARAVTAGAFGDQRLRELGTRLDRAGSSDVERDRLRCELRKAWRDIVDL